MRHTTLLSIVVIAAFTGCGTDHGDQKVGFALEYQETDAKHHYRAKRDLTADEIVKALVAYSTGADDWKTMAEWELIKW